MKLDELITKINDKIAELQLDMCREKRTKVGNRRARKVTIELQKLFKEYRELSVQEDKK